MRDRTSAVHALPQSEHAVTTGAARGATTRLHSALGWARDRLASPSRRGWSYWLVTILLGLLLPAPIAVAVIVARVRRSGGEQAARP